MKHPIFYMPVPFRDALMGLCVITTLGACHNNASDEGSHNLCAVYEGVDNYGTVEAKDKDSFTFRFRTADGSAQSFSLPSADGTYALQNRLQEGSRYSIFPREGQAKVADSLQRNEPSAQGTVEAVSTTSITLDGKSYPLAESVNYCQITRRAGGSLVKTLNPQKTGEQIKVGDQVKIYGTPVAYIDRTFVGRPLKAPLNGTPGERTLKNFLKTGLSACGTTLYVYGGGWDWQDAGSSEQARTIGVPREWVEFFRMNDESYAYKDENPATSYYPWKAYNEYYYAGADCSGFIGWNVYNVMNTASGGEGYVVSSARFAKNLAENHGYGTLSRDNAPEHFMPGDIVSMSGHVWTCVGRASDGSLVILHSSVDSDTNPGFLKGSGIQLSGLSTDKRDCKATQLAQHYMQTYYPEWAARYQAITKDLEQYTDFEKKETLGRFSWHISPQGLTDPDGYRTMSAEEILKDLFGE